MAADGDHRVPGPPAQATATRLDLHHDPSVRTILDGVWAPRSRDTVSELTGLIAALDASQNRVTLIMLNPAGWHGKPRRIETAGRTVRVAWFADLDASVLIATTSSSQRIDLLVKMTGLSADPGSTRPVERTGARSLNDAEAVWESEGGPGGR
jgi:hypothetical protein